MVDTSKIKSDRIEDGIEPGDICYSLRTSKTGWLLCNGQEISRTEYSKLFDVIGTLFGEGDGSTTFNLPNCSGKFLQMNTDKNIGDTLEAGLPNITADMGNPNTLTNYPERGTVSGAFYEKFNNVGYGNTSSGGSTRWSIGFDASLSNEIYGNSDTVQPPAIIVNYFIKY